MNSLEIRKSQFDKKGKQLFYKIMSEAYNWKSLCDYPYIGSYSDLEYLIDEFLENVQAFFLGKVNDDGKENYSEK